MSTYEDYLEFGFEDRPGVADLVEQAREEGYRIHAEPRYDVQQNVVSHWWLAARPAWVNIYHEQGGPYAFAD